MFHFLGQVTLLIQSDTERYHPPAFLLAFCLRLRVPDSKA